MDHSGGSLKDQKAKRNVDCGSLAHKVSERKMDFTGDWARDISCDILAKKLPAFFSCPENLNKIEFKSNGQICLVEKTSTYTSLSLWHGLPLLS